MHVWLFTVFDAFFVVELAKLIFEQLFYSQEGKIGKLHDFKLASL